MKKLVLLIFISLFHFTQNIAAATPMNEPIRDFKEYESVEGALQKFENHFNKTVILPTRLPPLPFTHLIGKYSSKDGPEFIAEFVNAYNQNDHYKIFIRSIKDKVSIKEKYVVSTYTLLNGQKATLMTYGGYYVLSFELDDWQYRLSVIKEAIPRDTLVDIANSIKNY